MSNPAQSAGKTAVAIKLNLIIVNTQGSVDITIYILQLYLNKEVMAKKIDELRELPASLPDSFHERNANFRYTKSWLILKLHQYEVYNVKIGKHRYDTLFWDTELGIYDDSDMVSDLIIRYFMSLSLSELMDEFYFDQHSKINIIGANIYEFNIRDFNEICPCLHCTLESTVNVECSDCDHNQPCDEDSDSYGLSIDRMLYMFTIQGVTHAVGCAIRPSWGRRNSPCMYWYRRLETPVTDDDIREFASSAERVSEEFVPVMRIGKSARK